MNKKNIFFFTKFYDYYNLNKNKNFTEYYKNFEFF